MPDIEIKVGLKIIYVNKRKEGDTVSWVGKDEFTTTKNENYRFIINSYKDNLQWMRFEVPKKRIICILRKR